MCELCEQGITVINDLPHEPDEWDVLDVVDEDDEEYEGYVEGESPDWL